MKWHPKNLLAGPLQYKQLTNNRQNLLPQQYAGPGVGQGMRPSRKQQLTRNGWHAPISNYNIPTLQHIRTPVLVPSGAGPGGNEVNTWELQQRGNPTPREVQLASPQGFYNHLMDVTRGHAHHDWPEALRQIGAQR